MPNWIEDLYVIILKYNHKASDLVVIFGQIHPSKNNKNHPNAEPLQEWLDWISNA